MTPAEYQQVKRVVDQALALDRPARSAYLESVYETDPAIRDEVESLLDACDQAGEFLESNPALANLDPAIGKQFGPYRIERLIGQGGMGSVYEATRQDGQFRMRVAVKVVKPGLDSGGLLKRFRNERQILARLSHPNVARLLDGGLTDEGRPYFVMEFVEGERLDESARLLGLNQKLDLFRTVAKAVHYAHQNLIVHGDLKCSNILVTADNTPKLLDFGIARLLEADPQSSGMTITMMPAAFTPEYASPEQLRGEPLTTASDIYSLGILLCELLSGGRPFTFTSPTPESILKGMRNSPRKPSDICFDRQLEGDLDNIVLKALQFEPAWRYDSAEQMAEDIRRYQAGLPVIARPDSLRYRASKFVSRNRLAVAFSTAAILSLAGGLGAAAWQARVAQQEKARAERRFNDVRDIAHAFIFDIESDIAALPGSTAVRGKLIARATDYLDRLAKDAEDNPELQEELAAAFQKLGDVQGRAADINLGDTKGALISYRKSLAIRESLLARDKQSPAARQKLAEAYSRYSGIIKVAGDYQGGIDFDRKALAVREELQRSDPANHSYQRAVANSYTNLGGSLSQVGDWQGVLDTRKTALEHHRRIASSSWATESDRKGLALALSRLAGILRRNGDRMQTVRLYQESLGIYLDLLTKNPLDRENLLAVGAAETAYGRALADFGDYARASGVLRQAVSRYEAAVSADAREARSRSLLATAEFRLAQCYLASGEAAAALPHFERSRLMRETLAKESPLNAGAQGEVAESYEGLGGALEAAGRKQEAIEYYQRSVTLSRELIAAKRANDHIQSIEKSVTRSLQRLHGPSATQSP